MAKKKGLELVDPKREILISDQETEIFIQNSTDMNNLHTHFGKIRKEYLMAEANMMNQIMMKQQALDNHMTKVREKYKIVGQIDRIDYKNKKIILR